MGMEIDTKTSGTAANIIAAAEALFVERNYADVTLSQVADTAKVTKGAIYHHFESKQRLYLTMLLGDLETKRRLHRESVEGSGTAQQRLRNLTGSFLSLPDYKRNLIGLVRRDINIFETETRDQLVEAYQKALPELVEEILRDGIRDGEIIPCDPRLLAWQFVAVVEVILTPYANQRFGSNEDRLNYVMSVFLNGCSWQRQGADE